MWGRLWDLVTPRSASRWATGLAIIGDPRSEWMVSWLGSTPCFSIVSAIRASAGSARSARASIQPGDVAAVDVDDRVEVEVGPLRRAEELGDVPAVQTSFGPGGYELGLHPGRVGGMSPALTHLPVVTEDPVHGGDRSQVDTLVEQLGVDGGRGLVDVLLGR